MPPNINSVRVKMWGAGGAGHRSQDTFEHGNIDTGAGGAGAYIETDMKVSAGEKFYILVG